MKNYNMKFSRTKGKKVAWLGMKLNSARWCLWLAQLNHDIKITPVMLESDTESVEEWEGGEEEIGNWVCLVSLTIDAEMANGLLFKVKSFEVILGFLQKANKDRSVLLHFQEQHTFLIIITTFHKSGRPGNQQ